MYQRFRVLSSTILLAFLAFVLVATPVVASSKTQSLPDDLISILPDSPHFLVVAPSLDALNKAVEPFAHLMELPEGESFDLRIYLEPVIGDGAQLIASDKPMAMAVSVGNVMAGEEVITTLAVYLDVDTDKTDEMIISHADMAGEMEPRLRQGHYVAFSNALALEPGNGSSALFQDIPQASLVTSIDLEKFFAEFRPLIEMGLGMAAMSAGAAPADSTAAAPAMSSEELTAATQFVIALMDSGLRYNFFIETDNDELALVSDLKILQDSPLAVGPQPDFKEAMDLVRLLPANSAYVMAQAWDFGSLMDLYMGYNDASIGKMAESMAPNTGEDFMAWYKGFAQKIELYELPMAASMNLTREGLFTSSIIKCDDMDRSLADITAMIESVPAELGYTFNAQPEIKIDGTSVKTWTMDYDQAAMMESMTGAMGTNMDEAMTDQMEISTTLINRLLPQILLAGQGDYIFFSTDKDTKSLEAMLKAARMRRGGVDKFTAKVAREGGPDIRQLYIVDAMALLTWATELFEVIAKESGDMGPDDDFPTFSGAPVMLSATTSAGPDGYSSRMKVNSNDLGLFINTIIELGEVIEAMDEVAAEDTEN